MKIAFIFALLVMAVVVAAWWFIAEAYKAAEDNKAKYDALYCHIQATMRDDARSEWREYVKASLKMLQDLPYKNSEKTDVILREFLKKYFNGGKV